MDSEIIKRHNERVTFEDTVIHAGDFTMLKDKKEVYKKYINQLNGTYIFLKGSHDYWLEKAPQIWEHTIDGIFVVVCHYAMRTWARSHYGSFHLFGHSHNKLESFGKSMDIGVDTNNFYPWSFDQIKEIMKTKPDNFNLVKKESRNG
jgi:calcineurin-like phosphoesterase family protein